MKNKHWNLKEDLTEFIKTYNVGCGSCFTFFRDEFIYGKKSFRTIKSFSGHGVEIEFEY